MSLTVPNVFDDLPYSAGQATLKPPVRAATTAALPAGTWTANTYTVTAHDVFPDQDGVTLSVGNTETTGRLLVKDEATTSRNGIWYLSTLGTADPGGTSAVLTRAPDADDSGELIAGTSVLVVSGTGNGLCEWIQTTTGTIVVGTTAIVWLQRGVKTWQTEVALTPGGTLTLPFHPRSRVQVQQVTLWFTTAPASAAGTYLLTAADNSANNLFAAANFDMEGLAANTYYTPGLSATLANRQLTAAEWINFTFTSNNIDLTGAGIMLIVNYVEKR